MLPLNVSGPITIEPSGLTPSWDAKPGLGVFIRTPPLITPPSGRPVALISK